jgi:hypothetical protein
MALLIYLLSGTAVTTGPPPSHPVSLMTECTDLPVEVFSVDATDPNSLSVVYLIHSRVCIIADMEIA